MIPSLALAMTVLGIATLVAVPLIPALLELRRKSDAQPLNVVQQHAGEIRHFADGFRSYIGTIEQILERCRELGIAAPGSMRDGTRYLVLGVESASALAPVKERGNCQVLIAAASDLQLPAGVSFARDIYAKGGIAGGAGSQYRAILGERDIHLAPASSVLRWVHAGGDFTAEADCRLFGRVSCNGRVRLAGGCAFLRLNAPRVEFGNPCLESTEMPLPVQVGGEMSTPARRLHEGDLELHDKAVLHGNLIVRGKLRLGGEAMIYGSIKCEDDLLVGNNVTVCGSLITERNMRIGRNCSIHGPVIAEREILIQSGTRCGAAKIATTVGALRIAVEEGVVVFGTLWAREQGRVVAK